MPIAGVDRMSTGRDIAMAERKERAILALTWQGLSLHLRPTKPPDWHLVDSECESLTDNVA